MFIKIKNPALLTASLLMGIVFLTITGNVNGQTSGKTKTNVAAPKLKLKPCRVAGFDEEILCGSYEVYENRTARKGRKISINIVVLPALSANPAPDPFFTFAGGPGEAETEDAGSNAQRFAEIRRERDIVMIDQRGTGSSNPLDCSFGDANLLVQAFLAGDLPIESVKECRSQLEKKADLRFYTTPFAADDVDEIREQLGYKTINLYGGSYGSRAALVYLRQHPNSVRTATIRAIFPMSLKNPLFSPRDAQQSMNLLFDDCEKEEACAKAFPNIRQDFHTVLENLAKSPLKIKITDPRTKQSVEVAITRDVFAGGLRRMLYHPNSQRLIPLFIKSALAGEFKPFESVVAQTLGIETALSTGLFLSVTCAEDTPLIKENEILRETNGTFLGATMVQSLVQSCKSWAKGILPAKYNNPVKSKTPVLLFSGTEDPMTPPIYGNETAKYLPNSRHIILNGIAHNPFPPCAIGVMSQFITKGSADELDTSCVEKLSRPAFVLSFPTRKQ